MFDLNTIIQIMTRLGLLKIRPWNCTGDKNNPNPSKQRHAERRNSNTNCDICDRFVPYSHLEPSRFFILTVFGMTVVVTAVALANNKDWSNTDLSNKSCPFQIEGKECFLTVGVISLPLPPQSSGSLTGSASNNSSTNLPPMMNPIQCLNKSSFSVLSTLPSAQVTSSPPPRFVRPDYQKFKAYLEEKLRQKFNRSIVVNFDKSIQINKPNWMAQAETKIREKQWDLAFTLSPLLSITATENRYQFAARMFDRDELQSVLFTREDSSIKIPKDINKPTTKVALMGQEDMLGFYLPIYQLYGLTFEYKKTDSLRRILEMVTCGEADIGVGIKAFIAQNPKLRILSDRAFPPGSVYLSPIIPETERTWLKEVLTNAPTDIRQAAGISTKDASTEPDYDDVKSKKQTVEDILKCNNLESNPVKLYRCRAQEITATVKAQNLDKSFALRSSSGIEYQMFVSEDLRQQLKIESGIKVKIMDVQPEDNRGVKQIKIANSKQIQIIK